METKIFTDVKVEGRLRNLSEKEITDKKWMLEERNIIDGRSERGSVVSWRKWCEGKKTDNKKVGGAKNKEEPKGNN